MGLYEKLRSEFLPLFPTETNLKIAMAYQCRDVITDRLRQRIKTLSLAEVVALHREIRDDLNPTGVKINPPTVPAPKKKCAKKSKTRRAK